MAYDFQDGGIVYNDGSIIQSGTPNITIAFWLSQTIGNDQFPISFERKVDTVTTNYLALQVNEGLQQWMVNSDGGFLADSFVYENHVGNSWCPVVLTVEPSGALGQAQILYNGQYGSATWDNYNNPWYLPSGYDLVIGSSPNTNRLFSGKITELAIWNKVLTLDQMKRLSCGIRRTALGIEPSRLKLYLPMDDYPNGAPVTEVKNKLPTLPDNGRIIIPGITGCPDNVSYP